MKKVIVIACVALGLAAVAAPKVTINKIENTDVWSTKKVTYTVSDVAAKVGEYRYALAFDVTAYNVTTNIDKGVAKNGTFTETLDMAEIFGKPRKDPNAKIRVSLEKGIPPAGQLWEGGPIFADCNVGANAPHESGYYFWWGDTVGYKRNANDDGWVSAKDGTTSIEFSSFDATAGQTYNKDYATLKTLGFIDDAANPVLNAAHDAARAHLGAPWRMMTKAEQDKLGRYCERTWTIDWKGTGTNGYVIKGKGAWAVNSVFFPRGSGGYWSSVPYSVSDRAYYYPMSQDFSYDNRYTGHLVRPVR